MSSPDEHIDRGIKYKQLILFSDYYSVVVLLHVWLKPAKPVSCASCCYFGDNQVLQQGTQNCDLL